MYYIFSMTSYEIWSLYISLSLLIDILYFFVEKLMVLVLCSILILDPIEEKYHVYRQILLWWEIIVVFSKESRKKLEEMKGKWKRETNNHNRCTRKSQISVLINIDSSPAINGYIYFFDKVLNPWIYKGRFGYGQHHSPYYGKALEIHHIDYIIMYKSSWIVCLFPCWNNTFFGRMLSFLFLV